MTFERKWIAFKTAMQNKTQKDKYRPVSCNIDSRLLCMCGDHQTRKERVTCEEYF